MTGLSCITPDGQVTIPRYMLKTLKIYGGNDVLIEVKDGVLILQKLREVNEQNEAGVLDID